MSNKIQNIHGIMIQTSFNHKREELVKTTKQLIYTTWIVFHKQKINAHMSAFTVSSHVRKFLKLIVWFMGLL